MVMPQNEFNSAQNFPSCTWTPGGLARFLRVLGPHRMTSSSACRMVAFSGTANV
jgi:glucosylceramidase